MAGPRNTPARYMNVPSSPCTCAGKVFPGAACRHGGASLPLARCNPAGPRPPRATPPRDVGGDLGPDGGGTRFRGPRLPPMGSDAHDERLPHRFRRGDGGPRACRQRLSLAHADAAATPFEGGPGPVPHVHVHRARASREPPRNTDCPGGRPLVQGPRISRGLPPRIPARCGALHPRGFSSDARDDSPARPCLEGNEKKSAEGPATMIAFPPGIAPFDQASLQIRPRFMKAALP
jgi:hypothetical protein